MDEHQRRISSFDRTDRVPWFQPDLAAEEFIARLNGNLLPLEAQLADETYGSRYASVLIVSVPRSGSTYLYQKLAANPRIGYVSNLMARFYEAPLVGAHLQNMLLPNHIQEFGTFKSTHGVTPHIWEPHEFGYFFSRFLNFSGDNHEDFEEDIFVKGLRDLDVALARISLVLQRPVVYKGAIAPFVLNELLSETEVKILHLSRQEPEVVNSILRVRKDRLGSEHSWWSIRPNDWRQLSYLSPFDQVTAQYRKVNDAIETAKKAHSDRFFTVSYEELLRNEAETLRAVYRWVLSPLAQQAREDSAGESKAD